MILLAHPILQLAEPALSAIAPCIRGWEIEDRAAFAAGQGQEVRAIACIGGQRTDPEWFALLPRLQAVIAAGVGYDGVDLPAARAHGIAVTNTPGINTDDVADLAMGLLIAGERNIADLDRLVRAGAWEQAAALSPRYRLRGRTIGIVGLGAIGKAIAIRAEAFGLKVMWTGPRAKPDVVWPYVHSVLELARASDILMLACPLTPETRGCVDAAVLSALGSEGVLINVARGGVVDEAALLAALKARAILGAGLDVFADEPTDPSLWADLPNVVLTPHVAGRTQESVREGIGAMVANLSRLYLGHELLDTVA